MITKKIQIQLQNGLEARPVAVLVQVASQYNSSIYVECDDRKVNAKRSEERRVGKECNQVCRSRWSPYH